MSLMFIVVCSFQLPLLFSGCGVDDGNCDVTNNCDVMMSFRWTNHNRKVRFFYHWRVLCFRQSKQECFVFSPIKTRSHKEEKTTIYSLVTVSKNPSAPLPVKELRPATPRGENYLPR